MLANGCRQTTTTGSTPFTLSSVTGYPRFEDGFGQGPYFRASFLDDSTGAPLATAICHLTGANTLAVDRWLWTYQSSAVDNTAPAAPTLSGTVRVIAAYEEGMGIRAFPAVQNVAGSKYVMPDALQLAASNTKVLTANTPIATCAWWPCDREISALLCEITTAAGAGTDRLQVGVYSLDANGLPGALVVRSGDVAPNATGVKTPALSSGANFRLPPDYYWWVVASNVGPTMRAAVGGGPAGVLQAGPMGHSSGSLSNRYSFFTCSALSGGWTALPSSVTLSSGVAVGSDYAPMLGAVVA